MKFDQKSVCSEFSEERQEQREESEQWLPVGQTSLEGTQGNVGDGDSVLYLNKCFQSSKFQWLVYLRSVSFPVNFTSMGKDRLYLDMSLRSLSILVTLGHSHQHH